MWLVWTGGALPPYTPLLTAVAVWGITQVVVRLGAAVSGRYLGLTGDTTPPRGEYSAPQSLVARGRYEEAAAWFRRARRDATLPPGHDLLVSQELIELYRGRLGQPQRAIPELARICERFPGTPNAAAAEGELAALRAQIANERDIDG
jgi:tetratricopeptide (TPR) repeat protein